MTKFTHKGKINRPIFGWQWSEDLRLSGRYWISSVVSSTGKITKYRTKDGKCVGGDDILDLQSIKEINN